MVKYIKLSKNLYKLFKSKIKSNEILVFDTYHNSIIITKDIMDTIESSDLNIICPIFLYNKTDKVISNIYKINTNINCKFTLRELQLEIINKILNINSNYLLHSPLYISIVCPCGFGKTIIGIDLICKLKYKCVIIVPRKFIMTQWKEKFEESSIIFTSFNGRKEAIEKIKNGLNCDIFICPDKHLEDDTIKSYIYNNFSMLIIDEAHKYNLNNNISMTRFLYNGIFKICIFLTATPTNNMNAMINENIVITDQNTENINITKRLLIFELKNNKFNKFNNKCQQFINKISNNNFNTVYIKNYNYKYCISLDDNRNNTIMELIKKITSVNTKGLILTDYRTHMYDIYNLLKNTTLKDIIYMYDVKDKNCNNLLSNLKNNSNKNYLIISTISACSESLDINNLNTFHVLLPITNNKTLTQCIGRILRDYNEDKLVCVYNFSYINNIIKTYINDNTMLIKKSLSEWECSELKCD
ncbi:DNA helicase, transcript release factor [Mythimna separata entomopoxvirus 'L']|uniref:DNA helicase, transcript release factor n=1 Tax=Mythimna separata entomopoxvirus 'L' TaxID=1293572 RepID=A0A916KQA7_9POXV|nr:DNA helicase, transcript release factor [Mythimna separata entomopoxvirus 'L']CCU56280.1 DNA helicase, transcript release factor [Mythimna separata entomopoxvirus 'L']